MIERISISGFRERLDQVLTAYFLQDGRTVSRSEIARLLKAGRIHLEGLASLPKAGFCVEQEWTVLIDWPELPPSSEGAEDIPLEIVYEDAHLLVINKPQGMVVHPAPGHSKGTLVNALLNHCGSALSDTNGLQRPGIVHRIDKDTSGLLVVAKTNLAHQRLAEQLAEHAIQRVYLALVYGSFAEEKGRVEAPIGRDSKNRQRMAVTDTGKSAVTHFTVLESLRQTSLVRCVLETGRTHQIRVHMQFIGHPVVGDPVYAKGRKTFGAPGQLLHATELHFVHPITGEPVHCTAPLPDHWTSILQELRG